MAFSSDSENVLAVGSDSKLKEFHDKQASLKKSDHTIVFLTIKAREAYIVFFCTRILPGYLTTMV